MSIRATGNLTVLALRQQLSQIDPAVLLVSPRILRRIIKRDRSLPGLGLRVPHRKSYWIDRNTLLGLATAGELDIDPTRVLPAEVLLLPTPSGQELAWCPTDQILREYWRLLFHVRVHLALRGKSVLLLERIQQLGRLEFDEITSVLRQEQFLLAEDPAEVYAEFAAVYLELNVFDPHRVEQYFPGLFDRARVDHLLSLDLDAEALLQATRPDGAAAPDTQVAEPVVEPAVLDEPDTTQPGVLRADADEVARRGNLVRAALSRIRAIRRVPASQAGSLRGAAHREMKQLASRLVQVLGMPEQTLGDWEMCLVALLEPGSRALWSLESRLLYDLQTICIDAERPIFATSLAEWFVSWFRRPIKRPLPDLPLVLHVKHLRKAIQRLPSTRIPAEVRQRLGSLLEQALDLASERVRSTFRPRLKESLDHVGLEANTAAEELARNKLVEELLDRVVQREFLTLGDLRDALARNRLKLPDLVNPVELVTGDPLLRLNAELPLKLDGIYRRGEVYLRMLQRLSSVFFGNPVSRFLTLYLILPVLAAFFTLKGIDGISEELHKFFGLPEVHTFSNVAFACLSLLYLPLFHVPPFRRVWVLALWYAWCALWALIYDLPTGVLRLPGIRQVLASYPFLLFYQFLGKPLLWTLPVTALLAWAGVSWETNALTSGLVLLGISGLINTRTGMLVEEAAMDRLGQGWHLLRHDLLPGLFRGIVWFFGRVTERIEQWMYSIDEWLRFRQGESQLAFVAKVILGFFWSVLSYVIRLIVNVFAEPQVNPIKHFPVVTVSHKLMLLAVGPIAEALAPRIGWTMEATVVLTGLILGLIPGMFGFLAWELMANWQLYRANESPNLEPERLGSHGEQMIHLIRPGFHSGTLPRLFARVRAARGTRERKGEANLHHVEEEIATFTRRNLLDVLAASQGWGHQPLTLGHVRLATNRVQIELCWPGPDPNAIHGLATADPGKPVTNVWLEFSNQAGWLVAQIRAPGWLGKLEGQRRMTFAAALAGYYKRAGVDLAVEHLPAEATWTLNQEKLVVTVPGSPPRVHDLASSDPVRISTIPLPWSAWTAFWQQDRAGVTPDAPVLPSVRLLPSVFS